MKRKTKTNKSDIETKAIEENKKMKINTVPVVHRILRNNYNIPAYDLATFLLGKILIRKLDDNSIVKGRIVETECYPGGDDKASSTSGNRRTPAVEPLYMQPGTAFVYMTYGMYHCFNISSSEPGGGVLLRAVEPLQGIEKMQEFRMKKLKNATGKTIKEHELCNGPSKLCVSLDIRKDNCNTLDLCENDSLWVEADPDFEDNFQIVRTTRIGIDRAGPEWAKKPFRFYILGCNSISKRDEKAENALN